MKRPVLEVWEPTYRMKPSVDESFIPVQVETIIKEVTDRRLRKVRYRHPRLPPQLALILYSYSFSSRTVPFLLVLTPLQFTIPALLFT